MYITTLPNNAKRTRIIEDRKKWQNSNICRSLLVSLISFIYIALAFNLALPVPIPDGEEKLS